MVFSLINVNFMQTFAALFGAIALNFYVTLVIESAGRLEVMDETRANSNNADSNMKVI